ncbi:MAG: hypothetical protein U0264_14345 [Candidatus Kapaibacterium sp.]|mgnify:CR=1 FL=1
MNKQQVQQFFESKESIRYSIIVFAIPNAISTTVLYRLFMLLGNNIPIEVHTFFNGEFLLTLVVYLCLAIPSGYAWRGWMRWWFKGKSMDKNES